MNTNNKPAHRWLFIVGYLGIVISMLACMAVGLGTSNVDAGTLQIDNGSIEVKGQNGEWMPVAGASTFELVGALQSMDPWKVAGTTLETNETTQIEDGLQVGDLVRVKGTALEGGKWVAYSIERAEEQTNPSSTIVIVGKVTSTDPWVVNGITLNELGYDVRKPVSPLDPRGSHCGAGAPRFNVVTTDGVNHFVGCNSPPALFTSGPGWVRLRWTATELALAFPAILPGNVVKSIAIVFDEGQDAGPDNFGLAVLDNIDVNGQLVGQGPGN